MTTENSRARYPVRVTIQMSEELNARALEIAERECGGSLQTLVRQCLQARVDGASPAGTDRMAEVLELLDGLRQRQENHIEESRVRLQRLTEDVARVSGNLSPQVSDMMAVREQLEKLADEVTRQGRNAEDLTIIRAIVGELSGEVIRQNRALSELSAAISKSEEQRPKSRKFFFSR